MAEILDNAEQTGAPYQVLARKYRPQHFEELIGHEAMVKTLRNAFAADRIAHAFILTGVRGVGKTTTARILARALNYVGPDDDDVGPQIDMAAQGRHCKAIAESRHPDVLEMDAASRTGVGDIRELIEGVRYAPVEARYKVYIIDEVHMLSTAAFNALLKTLEEPPAHVKFIFATTEIRKVPVTVLSRCQRFDLKRINPEILTDHLAAIAEKEHAQVARDGLWMIARAAEGSVRDALSILDQAILQYKAQTGEAEAIGAEAVRDMLGLADRSVVWDLVGACLKGDAKTALEIFEGQFDGGAEPTVILRDMLDIVHLLTRVKAAGPSAAAHGPAGEADAERAKAMADGLALNALTRAWSLLMKGLGEVNAAPDPAAAGEMALIRLCFAADLPTPDEALKALKKNSETGGAEAPQSGPSGSRDDGASGSQAPKAHSMGAPATGAPPTGPQAPGQPASAGRSERGGTNPGTNPAPQMSAPPAPSSAGRAAPAPPQLSSLEDVARLAGRHRDAKLRTELEAFVHVISFRQGRIDVRFADAAPADLANRLTSRLKEWTGTQWIVCVAGDRDGETTLRDQRMADVTSDPLVKKALETFPGAKITRVSEPDLDAAVAALDPDGENDEDRPVDPQDDPHID